MTEDGYRNPTLRHDLSRTQRLAKAELSIDPGFVNHRLVETVLGEPGVRQIDKLIEHMPGAMPEWQREVRIDHIYSRVMVEICKDFGANSLGAAANKRRGELFSSIEEVAATPGVYYTARVTSRIATPGNADIRFELEYSTEKIRADTTRAQLYTGGEIAIIGKIAGLRGGVATVHPLIMGSPWLTVDESVLPAAEWYGREFFEIFVEDFDEFSLVRDIPTPTDASLMSSISERAFKTCLGEILGDQVSSDWGGEVSDHFAGHVNLEGRRTTAAFLLKGPARYAPMGLNHLGKNNDQIYRLSQEPAEVMVVQHCHDVLPAVRATLRAFAVQPGMSRRYCVIDGRDSLRLLQAYGKVERAISLSQSESSRKE